MAKLHKHHHEIENNKNKSELAEKLRVETRIIQGVVLIT